MKTKSFLPVLLFFLILISCEDNNKGSLDDNDIRLEIFKVNYSYPEDYSHPDNFTGDRIFPGILYMDFELYKVMKMKEEGEIILRLPDENDGYFLFAKRQGYYSEIYHFINGDTLLIDLDTIQSGMACGVIMSYSPCQLPYYVRSEIPVLSGGDTAFVIEPDREGRFNIPFQTGQFEMEFPSENYTLFNPGNSYGDYLIENQNNYCMFLEKPNIYIYPMEEMTLDVSLEFPEGGTVVKSYPEYPDKWKGIKVSPSGTIDGEYGYLFYESVNPDFFQYDKGWIIEKGNLDTFFKENMQNTGFNEKEINDFIDHWIPLLTDNKHYAIYPQYNETLDKMIKINFSQNPESLIRLIYVVEGMDNIEVELDKPFIPGFERKGFTVTEWGVVRR